MASGDIEHKDIPDELLHEPKGAASAGAGTVYIANGSGSGSFQKIPVTSLSISIPSVSYSSVTDIPATVSLSGTSLSQPANGVLSDVAAFVGIPQEITTMINKNASELLRVYNNQKTINTQISQNITSIEEKLNEVITELKGLGLFNG